MIVTRLAFIGLAAVAVAPALRAQASEHFDTQPEGTSAATFVTPVGTFQDLVLDGSRTPGSFFVDDASATLAGMERFSGPNVLVPGGFTAGPNLASIPVKSFRMLLPQTPSLLRFEIYIGSLPNNNSVDVEFLHNGVQVGGFGAFGSGFPVWLPSLLEQCNTQSPIDEILFLGTGPVDGGRFRCAIDTFVTANASCNPLQIVCEPSALGGCPCGNQPPMFGQGGCLDSFGQSAFMTGTGIASVGVDEFLLFFSNMPASTYGILVQSNGLNSGVAFGDGVLCLSTPLQRVLTQHMDSTGAATYPLASQLPLSVRAGLTTPGTRYYQCVYRNAASFCTPSTFNATNGVSIDWAP
jgi:hypothetical protein